MAGTPGENGNSVYAKLIAARKAVGSVNKSGTNDFHKYDYATEADFMDALRPALDEAGLAVLVSTKSYDDQFSEDGAHMVRVGMEYTVVDSESGDSLPPSLFYGLAVDKGDKALYKAMTGAAKYWAAKTFLISTHDDPEADSTTDERAAGTSERKPRGASGAGRPAGFDGDPLTWRFPFGKYKGQSILEVNINAPQYLEWAWANMEKMPPNVKDALGRHLGKIEIPKEKDADMDAVFSGVPAHDDEELPF